MDSNPLPSEPQEFEDLARKLGTTVERIKHIIRINNARSLTQIEAVLNRPSQPWWLPVKRV